MTDSYVEERRRYISEIKKSFENQEENNRNGVRGRTYGYGSEEEQTSMSEAALLPFLKIRFLIAIVIFAAFLYANLTGYQINSYTTKDVIKMVEENELYTKLTDYVMMEMQN